MTEFYNDHHPKINSRLSLHNRQQGRIEKQSRPKCGTREKRTVRRQTTEKKIQVFFDNAIGIWSITHMKTFLLVSVTVVLAVAIVAGLTRLIFWKYYE